MDSHHHALGCTVEVEMDLEPKFSSLQFCMDNHRRALGCIEEVEKDLAFEQGSS